jgi:hypothetical protein
LSALRVMMVLVWLIHYLVCIEGTRELGVRLNLIGLIAIVLLPS